MKAILVGKNKELNWSEVPNPVLLEDEVLVKVANAKIKKFKIAERRV